MIKQELFENVIAYFQKTYPEVNTELKYDNVYELLVAVILSAQCTDKRVNKITPGFFERFPTVRDLAGVDTEQVYPYIKSCSFPNNKSRYLVGMAQKLVEDFQEEVPGDVESLQKLPGVGRKSANVVASVAFNQPKLAVDTHVFRVSERIGLTTDAKTPLEAEKQLMQYIPEHLVHNAHHWLILHGRYVCYARKPRCSDCGLKTLCNYYERNIKKTESPKSNTV